MNTAATPNAEGQLINSTNGHPETLQTGLNKALDFLDQVKACLSPPQFQEFLVLLKMFKGKRISSNAMSESISVLFQNHPQLMHGFSAFLPTDHQQLNSSTESSSSLQDINLSVDSIVTPSVTAVPRQDFSRPSRRKRSVKSLKSQSTVASTARSPAAGGMAGSSRSVTTASLPANHSESTVVMARSLDFLNIVRTAYAHSPTVYTKFVAYLQESFEMSLPLSKVVEDVGAMFADRPEVMQAFLEFIPISALKDSHLEIERMQLNITHTSTPDLQQPLVLSKESSTHDSIESNNRGIPHNPDSLAIPIDQMEHSVTASSITHVNSNETLNIHAKQPASSSDSHSIHHNQSDQSSKSTELLFTKPLPLSPTTRVYSESDPLIPTSCTLPTRYTAISNTTTECEAVHATPLIKRFSTAFVMAVMGWMLFAAVLLYALISGEYFKTIQE
ncbi:hypothetical protein QVD99_007715 [Batrachochytrium dendrobatidis]|nr:hypothetical protein O5D80_001372 [Batrachochytrium dendrobatidis]KAK5665359.1 hypothetical protein QVD99_007715 [Batrachochytrium dendrobatidis]